MTVQEAISFARESLAAGMNVSLDITHPDPGETTDNEPVATVRVSVPSNVPQDRRRLDPALIASAVERGLMPAHSDLVLE